MIHIIDADVYTCMLGGPSHDLEKHKCYHYDGDLLRFPVSIFGAISKFICSTHIVHAKSKR